MKRTKLESARYWLAEERKFFAEHGGCLSAYITRYGSKDDPDHYGDGGEAIYAADRDALRRKEVEYERLARRDAVKKTTAVSSLGRDHADT